MGLIEIYAEIHELIIISKCIWEYIRKSKRATNNLQGPDVLTVDDRDTDNVEFQYILAFRLACQTKTNCVKENSEFRNWKFTYLYKTPVFSDKFLFLVSGFWEIIVGRRQYHINFMYYHCVTRKYVLKRSTFNPIHEDSAAYCLNSKKPHSMNERKRKTNFMTL